MKENKNEIQHYNKFPMYLEVLITQLVLYF